MDDLNEKTSEGRLPKPKQTAGLHAAVVLVLSLEMKNKKVLVQMEGDGLWKITQIQIQARATMAGWHNRQ